MPEFDDTEFEAAFMDLFTKATLRLVTRADHVDLVTLTHEIKAIMEEYNLPHQDKVGPTLMKIIFGDE